MNNGTAIAWNDVNHFDRRFASVPVQKLEGEVIRRIDMNPVVLHVNSVDETKDALTSTYILRAALGVWGINN